MPRSAGVISALFINAGLEEVINSKLLSLSSRDEAVIFDATVESGKYSYLYESLSLISLIISLLGSAITSFCTFSLYSSGSIILMLISNSAKSGKRGISE